MSDGATSEAEKRRARLAAELRENLRRRKAQQRGRRDAAGDEAPEEPKPEEGGAPPTSAP
jgi:hypothetical protein